MRTYRRVVLILDGLKEEEALGLCEPFSHCGRMLTYALAYADVC